MSVRHRLGQSLLALAWLAQTLAAPAYAAPAPAAERRQQPPGGTSRVVLQHEEFAAPADAPEPPASPLTLSGEGVSLYYLVPTERVKSILPAEFSPYPGPEQIYVRVDFIQWNASAAGPKQDRLEPFVELAYRLEVKRGSERGSYPLKIYADRAWAGLWLRQREGYDAFISQPKADVNCSPFMYFFQVRKGIFALGVVDAKPRQGMSARMGDIFSRKADAALWENGRDYLLADNSKGPKLVTRNLTVEIKPGQADVILLTELKKWKLLSQEEMTQPDKVLILESVQGTWAAP